MAKTQKISCGDGERTQREVKVAFVMDRMGGVKNLTLVFQKLSKNTHKSPVIVAALSLVNFGTHSEINFLFLYFTLLFYYLLFSDNK